MRGFTFITGLALLAAGTSSASATEDDSLFEDLRYVNVFNPDACLSHRFELWNDIADGATPRCYKQTEAEKEAEKEKKEEHEREMEKMKGEMEEAMKDPLKVAIDHADREKKYTHKREFVDAS